MRMTWQMYITIAVLLLSVAILLQRVILSRHKADPIAFAGIFQLLVAFVMLPWIFLHGISFVDYGDQWLPILLCTVGFGYGSVLYAKTLQRVDASAFSVLFATQTIWIMFAGIILNSEKLQWLQLVGTLLIFTSIGLLAKNRSVFKNPEGIFLGLLTGLFFGIAVASSAYLVRTVEPLTWVWVSFILGGFGSLLVNPSKISLCYSLIRSEILLLMLAGAAVYAVGTVAMNYAYIEGPFSLVAPIRQSGIILTTILAVWLLRQERVDVSRKFTAAAICTLGVLLLLS